MIERAFFIGYALFMRLMTGLFILLFVSTVSADTVYKTVDKDGNIIFTDKPSENSEEIKLKELQTIKNPNPARLDTDFSSPKKEVISYKRFFVANPANGAGIRSNNGNVSISLTLEPPLRSGHKVIITLDGKEVANGSGLSVSLQNQDRGSHTVGANVVDSNGKKLISTSSSFSLLRASQ